MNGGVSRTLPSEQCVHSILAGIVQQRFEYVRVGGRIAAKEPSEDRDGQAEISKISRTPEPVAGFSKLEHQ